MNLKITKRITLLIVVLILIVSILLPSESYAKATIIYKAKTTASYLNVRSGAGTKYRIIGSLKKGTTVEVVKGGSWSKIKYKKGYGYVSNKYIKKTPSISDKSRNENIVNKMKTIRSNKQLILVTASKYNTSSVNVQTFAKDNHGKWNRVLSIKGITGKYGLSLVKDQKRHLQVNIQSPKLLEGIKTQEQNSPITKLPVMMYG